MKNFYLGFLAASFLFFTSCAKDLTVTYQMESANTGKVVLKPSTSTDRTMVTINDQLVVDGKFVKSVTILNVPNGDHVIHYTADNSFYKTPLKADFPIKMENGKSMNLPNSEINPTAYFGFAKKVVNSIGFFESSGG
jgi:hypothetical protein